MFSRFLLLFVLFIFAGSCNAWAPALSFKLKFKGIATKIGSRRPCKLSSTVAILRSGDDKSAGHRPESALQGAKEPVAAEKFFAEFDHWYHPQEEGSPATKFFAEFDYWYHLADSKPMPMREPPKDNKSSSLLSNINFDDVDLHLIWPTDE
eukprot:753022-Hanusia_phi.AAC.4